LYFDRSAGEAARVIARQPTPAGSAAPPRLAALAVLGLLGLAAPELPALALGACAAGVVLLVAALDYRLRPGSRAGRPGAAGSH
jgi:hypothetical protein